MQADIQTPTAPVPPNTDDKLAALKVGDVVRVPAYANEKARGGDRTATIRAIDGNWADIKPAMIGGRTAFNLHHLERCAPARGRHDLDKNGEEVEQKPSKPYIFTPRFDPGPGWDDYMLSNALVGSRRDREEASERLEERLRQRAPHLQRIHDEIQAWGRR